MYSPTLDRPVRHKPAAFMLPSQAVTYLQKHFQLNDFRPGQAEAVAAILEGRDTFVVMPTGGGKSLIYQLPAVMTETGVTLVVSPLIALMKDQADALKALGIEAEYCNSSQDELDQMRAISRAVTGKIRLLYISPERAMSQSFLSLIPRMRVNYIAVDEAHCISQWGHDFRPEYRELHRLREAAGGNVPMIALTATATDRIVNDVIRVLGLRNPSLVRRSFYRPNLTYRVEYPRSEAEKQALLIGYLEKANFRSLGSGKCIIYCATRSRVDALTDFLNSRGFKSGHYHAGKSSQKREKMQDSYSAGRVNILVATNAFGMGMDQPDVRMVIHYQVPASVEAYYQESGRAGRDGRASDCILFYHNADFVTQGFIIGKEGNQKAGNALLEKIRGYGLDSECRQKILCGYFGEMIERCGKCDRCMPGADKNDRHAEFLEAESAKKQMKAARRSHRFTDHENAAITGVLREFPAKFGKKILAGILRGARTRDILKFKLDRSRFYGSLKDLPEEAIIGRFEDGIEEGEIKIAGTKYPKIFLAAAPPHKPRTKTARDSSVPVGNDPQHEGSSARTRTISPEAALLKKLKAFRDREARRLKWKSYMVFQNGVLARIAKEKPTTVTELSSVKGVGAAKVEKFGEEILRIIRSDDSSLF